MTVTPERIFHEKFDESTKIGKQMPLRALFLCMIGIEAYMWLGGIMFYLVEFSDLPKKNRVSKREINVSALLKEFESAVGKYNLLYLIDFTELFGVLHNSNSLIRLFNLFSLIV